MCRFSRHGNSHLQCCNLAVCSPPVLIDYRHRGLAERQESGFQSTVATESPAADECLGQYAHISLCHDRATLLCAVC